MADELEKLKSYLVRELKDLQELKKKGDLTEEGKGMLIMLRNIFDYMGWKIDDSEAF